MSIRDAMLKQVKVLEKRNKLQTQITVNTIIKRLEGNIEKGIFVVPNIGKNFKAHEEVKKVLNKEGLEVEIYSTNFKGKSAKGRLFTSEIYNMKVSVQN